jgi:hypothetical protein
MTELLLTYIGTFLIAFEFIRKFEDLQALVALLFAWPFRQFINTIGKKGKSKKTPQELTGLQFILLFLYVFLIPAMLALTIVFYIINFIAALLQGFHLWINQFYLKARKEYTPTYGFWAKISLKRSKKYRSISEQRIIREIQKREIPILPIVGIILITTALFIHVL